MFIRYDSFKVDVGRKKVSMKPELTSLDGQRENMSW